AGCRQRQLMVRRIALPKLLFRRQPARLGAGLGRIVRRGYVTSHDWNSQKGASCSRTRTEMFPKPSLPREDQSHKQLFRQKRFPDSVEFFEQVPLMDFAAKLTQDFHANY